MSDHCRHFTKIPSDEELEQFYQYQASVCQPKPYPTPEAIQNAFQLSVKEIPEVAGFNPLIMWELPHLRVIDDTWY